jgi:hypothetical protein
VTTDTGRVGEPTGLSQAEPEKVSSLTGFDPSRWTKRVRAHRDWVREPMTLDGAEMITRKYGALTWGGTPVSCFCWSKETWLSEWDCDSEIKAIAVLFDNRRVMVVRYSKRGTKTIFYTASAIEAQRAGTPQSDPVHESAVAESQTPSLRYNHITRRNEVSEEEYQAALASLRDDWGALEPDEQSPGILRAIHDPTTGILVGMRAKIVAEIINRALGGTSQ